mgnify:FL=1
MAISLVCCEWADESPLTICHHEASWFLSFRAFAGVFRFSRFESDGRIHTQMSNIRSMTGFGTGASALGAKTIRVEVRSVNGRFMELQIRLPRQLNAIRVAL